MENMSNEFKKDKKNEKKKKVIFVTIFSLLFVCFVTLGSFLGVKIAGITNKDNVSNNETSINLDSYCENKDVYMSVYPDEFTFIGNTYRLFEMRRNRTNFDIKDKTLIGYLCQNSETLEMLKKQSPDLEFSVCEKIYVTDKVKAYEVYKLNSIENFEYLCVGRLCFVYKVQGGNNL